MQENQQDLLSEQLITKNEIQRKKLLPLWIKIFAWIFLVISVFVPVVFILGLMGYDAALSLYGLETNEPLSIIGIVIMTLFVIKGFTAYGLLREKNWAVNMGLVDAISGIILCTLLMLYPIINSNYVFSFRLEIIALIPFLLKLFKIQTEWESY